MRGLKRLLVRGARLARQQRTLLLGTISGTSLEMLAAEREYREHVARHGDLGATLPEWDTDLGGM